MEEFEITVMYFAIFLLVPAVADLVAPSGFTAKISYQSPIVSCSGQNISFDWTFATSTGVLPETSRWFYKSRADDTELMYTLQSNTQERHTQLYAGRVTLGVKTQLRGTGITLRNVTLNDTGLYYVMLSFLLGNELEMLSNEDSGTSLTVIDCPEETPRIQEYENRTIQCSSSKQLNDLKLAMFKDGQQQINATVYGENLALTVDNPIHGVYHCGYIYPSESFMNIIGVPNNSSTIHIKEDDVANDKQNGADQTTDDATPYFILGLVIAGTFLCTTLGIAIGYYIARKRNKRSQNQVQKDEERQEKIYLQDIDKQGKESNEKSSYDSTLNYVTANTIGRCPDLINDLKASPRWNTRADQLGSGEEKTTGEKDTSRPSSPTNVEHVGVNDNKIRCDDNSNTQKKMNNGSLPSTSLNIENVSINDNTVKHDANSILQKTINTSKSSIEVHTGRGVDTEACISEELLKIETACEIDESTKFGEEIRDTGFPIPKSFSQSPFSVPTMNKTITTH